MVEELCADGHLHDEKPMTTSAYESLVASASQLPEVNFFDGVDGGNVEQATDLLKKAGPMLAVVRQTLQRRCEVRLQYESSFFPHYLDGLNHLRNLARVFGMEAGVAARKGDENLAGRIGIDTLELANGVRRGGLITGLLVSIAISGIAMEFLRKSRRLFDHDTRRDLIAALQRLEQEREPFAKIADRDRQWEAGADYDDAPCDFSELDLSDQEEYGLSEEDQQQLLQMLQNMADLPESEQRALQRDQDLNTLALLRMLAIDLALRSWRESFASFPKTLSLLAPAYLQYLPQDPFTDNSFVYRPLADDAFHLYSTGPGKVDGGGEFGAWPSVAAGCADLCLDANDFWPDC